MIVNDIVEFLEKEFPLNFQEDYDNSGLQIGNKLQEINKTMVSLDITESLIDEAIRKNCNLVISHHPLLFKGLKKITGSGETERIVEKCIKNNIAVYSLHTNLDNHSKGLNFYLAREFGLSNIRVLQPLKNQLKKFVVFCPVDHAEKVRNALFEAGAGVIGNYDNCSFNIAGEGTFRANESAHPFVGEIQELHFEKEIRIELIFPAYMEKKIVDAVLASHPYEEVAYDIYPLDNEFQLAGAGCIGDLEKNYSIDDFLEKIKEFFKTPCIKYNNCSNPTIKKVAICGGSGVFLVNEAVRNRADALITADVKYHDFFRNDLLIADVGHFESEQFSIEIITSLLTKKFHTFAFLKSEINSNPVKYF